MASRYRTMFRFTGYKIVVRHIEGFVLVKGSFKTDRCNFTLSPFRGGTSPWVKYVSYPNMLERLFGITLAQKLEKAKESVAKAAEKRIAKHNREVDELILAGGNPIPEY